MVTGLLGWRRKQKAQTGCIGHSLATAIVFTTTIVCGPASVPLAARADTLSATVVTNVVFGMDDVLTIQTGVPSSFSLQTYPSGPVTVVNS